MPSRLSLVQPASEATLAVLSIGTFDEVDALPTRVADLRPV